MISYYQIQRLATKRRIPENVIEKDYFIELLLFYFGRNDKFRDLAIFRGGTSLKKIYFPDYRFSEDLDFVISDDESLDSMNMVIENILEEVSTNFPFIPSKTSNIKDGRFQAFINYDIIPEIRSKKELKIDILTDDKIPSYADRKIIFTYQDLFTKNVSLKAYDLESIAADKILRIMDVDKEARDIFDLWFLIRLDYLKIDELIYQLKKKTGFIPHFRNLVKDIESNVYKKTWKIRLGQQVLDLPPYDTILEDLKALIEKKLINTTEIMEKRKLEKKSEIEWAIEASKRLRQKKGDFNDNKKGSEVIRESRDKDH